MSREKQLAAIHEAAHGVLAFRFGRDIRRIEIDAHGAGGTRCCELSHDARCLFSPTAWRAQVEAEIVICLGGAIAEEKVARRAADPEACSVDLGMARAWMAEIGWDTPFGVQTFRAIARTALDEPCTWGAVKAVAAHLIAGRTLTGKEVSGICDTFGVPREMVGSTKSFRQFMRP